MMVDETKGTAFKHDERFPGIAGQALQNLTGTRLQPSYARLFRDRSETEIDALLRGFALENCVVRQDLVQVMKRRSRAPRKQRASPLERGALSA